MKTNNYKADKSKVNGPKNAGAIAINGIDRNLNSKTGTKRIFKHA